MIDAGYLVEFIDKSNIVLALVQSAKKGRLSLLSSQDKQLSLPDSRVLLGSLSRLNPQAPRVRLSEALSEIEKGRQKLSEEVDVEELWELVHSEGAGFNFKQLAELVFSQPVSADQESAVLRAVFNDRTHFRLNNQICEPLSPLQLEQKKIQKEREAEKKQKQDMLLDWLKRNIKKAEPDPPPEELSAMLRDFVLEEEDTAAMRPVKNLLAEAGISSRRQVFDLLVRMGELKPHHNLFALRAGLAEEFVPQILEAAAAIEITRQGYEFLADDIFTIDGEETADFDDALSFTPFPDGGGRLGVYLTSLEAIAPESALDLEARARATTIYLPEGPVPMLPESLSQGFFSLRAGEERPVVSCIARLAPDGQLLSYEIKASLIKVKQRLTYNQVDKRLLENDAFFCHMRDLMLLLKNRRDQAGACFLPLPELNVKVGANFHVEVDVMERVTPARDMVAETAILANYLQGRFMFEAGVPSLYRVQAAPKEEWQNLGPENLVANFLKRKQLQRVELSLTPALHAGLGVTGYVHATSPIRRYLDMLVQRQLIAHLHGRPAPLTGPALLETGQQAELNLRAANRMSVARQRYWLIKWLQQNQGSVIPALVLEQQIRSWQVLLKPVMFIAHIPLQGISRNLAAGQEVAIKILHADPFEDILRLELTV